MSITSVKQWSMHTGRTSVGYWLMSEQTSVGYWLMSQQTSVGYWLMSEQTSVGYWLMSQQTSVGYWLMSEQTSVGYWLMSQQTSVGYWLMSQQTSVVTGGSLFSKIWPPMVRTPVDRQPDIGICFNEGDRWKHRKLCAQLSLSDDLLDATWEPRPLYDEYGRPVGNQSKIVN